MDLKILAGAFLLLAAAAEPARAGDAMRGLGRELADAARAAGLNRVAVSRIDSSRGADNGEGALLTERLTTALVRSGRVQAVERSLLPKLMEERSLARTGALEPDASEGSRLARVDGIVMGTYRASGKVVRLVLRVVDYRTGVIVGAVEGELEREGESVVSDMDPFDVPAPALSPKFDFETFGPRDAVADTASRCSDAESRINALEESILDIKARYWARRLKEGLPASELKVNPGSTIPDSALKARFYAALRRWYDADGVPALTAAEVSRFVKADGEAYSLHQECGL
ncbi:MAG: CsgG/HfaB family protein [Elusimicrobia bacterium]|nr:CsgG/HfaB family protein [Elusimicrobiota bacterium]